MTFKSRCITSKNKQGVFYPVLTVVSQYEVSCHDEMLIIYVCQSESSGLVEVYEDTIFDVSAEEVSCKLF
jgi:hypothetical protein